MVLLRTKRLILREFTLDDAVALSSVDSLPKVARYNGLRPPTLEDTQRMVEFVIESSVETPRTISTPWPSWRRRMIASWDAVTSISATGSQVRQWWATACIRTPGARDS